MNFLTMEDYAEAILKIIDKEGIKQCALIGHSMGGYITLAFAEKYPERLNGFGLFHSAAMADNEEKIKSPAKRYQLCTITWTFSLPGRSNSEFIWRCL